MLDHASLRVTDYDRSKRFHEAALAPLGYVLAMTAVVFASEPLHEPQPAAPSGVVAALLAEGRITLLDVATGRQLAEYAASPQPRSALSMGRLARAVSGDEVFAVLPDHDVPIVAGVNVRTHAGRKVGRLPSDTYPGLAVGSRTGRIFAFRSTGATVEVLDAKTGEHHTLFTFSNGRQVYTGAISAEERRVYVSYHGIGTGIEWFDLKDQGWQPGSYVSSHGGFALAGNILLAATGEQGILEVNEKGQILRTLNTALYGNHLMEFSLDREHRAIYAAGSCAYTGGFSSTPWPQSNAAPTRVLVPVRDYSVCGERISVGPAGAWVAVASYEDTLPRPSRPGSVLIVDTRTGGVVRRLATSSDVVDVMAIR